MALDRCDLQRLALTDGVTKDAELVDTVRMIFEALRSASGNNGQVGKRERGGTR